VSRGAGRSKEVTTIEREKVLRTWKGSGRQKKGVPSVQICNVPGDATAATKSKGVLKWDVENKKANGSLSKKSIGATPEKNERKTSCE